MIRLVKQSHKIVGIGPLGNPYNAFESEWESPIEMIEQVGRICYQSQDKIMEDSASKFVRGLVKRGHYAMLEFVDVTIRFVTNRGVTHELVRHRLCNFAQESTRYVTYDKPVPIVIPHWFQDNLYLVDSTWEWNPQFAVPSVNANYGLSEREERWLRAMTYAGMMYQEDVREGNPAQDARGMLPTDLKTEIVVKANLREWMHILALRAVGTTGKPHPQMQALMLPVLEELYCIIPQVFEELYTQAIDKGLIIVCPEPETIKG